ncbi:MAG: Flp family type IVb pilin [Gemmatimonadota bacterium]
MRQALRNLWQDEAGQDLAEYAILLALITVVVIAVLQVLGPTIRDFFNDVGDNMESLT